MTTVWQRLREGVQPTKEGLPQDAFAIVADPRDPATWKLLPTLAELLG